MLYPARVHTIETPDLCERDITHIAELYAMHWQRVFNNAGKSFSFNDSFGDGEQHAVEKLCNERAFLRLLRTDGEPTGLVSGDLLRHQTHDAYLGIVYAVPEIREQEGWERKLARMFMTAVPVERPIVIDDGDGVDAG